MFGTILKFEVRYHLTRPITWFYLVVFIGQGLLFMGTDAVVLAGGGIGQVPRNAPWAIGGAMLMLAAFDQVIVTSLVGTAVLRDYQYRAHELLFTTPITKTAYLGGRFVGAFMVMVILHLGIPLGLMLGSLVPWVDHSRMQALTLAPYLVQYVLLIVPTLFLTSAIFFAVGALTRSIFAIYTQGMVLLVLWSITQQMLSNIGNQHLAALGDPFGIQAYEILTRYWTAAEKSTRIIPLSGVMLENRLLWLGVALVVMAITFAAFRFRSAPIMVRRKRVELPKSESAAPTELIPAPQRFDGAAWRQQVASTARLSFWSIVRQVPFIAIVVIGIISLIVQAASVDTLYGDITWPLTYTMVAAVERGFILYFILLITLYTGEAVWQERQLKLHLISDSLPTRPSVALLGKLGGLVLVEALLLAVLMAVGMIIQTVQGYTHYEVGLYLGHLFGTTFPSLVQITVLAFLVHVLVNQKYAGHVVMILFYLSRLAMGSLGVEHRLFSYALTPNFRYSDLNGFGPYLPELILAALYWSSVAALLGVLAYLFWVRGAESEWKGRWMAAGRRSSGPTAALALVGLVLAMGAGGTIYYNPNVLNRYQNSRVRRASQARYERTYRPFASMALPRLVAADVRADLEPEHQAFWASGTYTFVNKQVRALDSVLVTVLHQDQLRIDTLAWSRPATTLVSDPEASTLIYRFATPLAPGDTVLLRYRARFEARGFTNSGPTTVITTNGTFIRRDYFPGLGYQTVLALSDDDERRKEGLPLDAGMRSVDDSSARANAYFLGNDADWIRFKATVSTAPDQIGIAPGSLVKEYRENGRRVFEYAVDQPMANDYAFLSARYEVRREQHRGVALEIFYHPGHRFNLDRMMASLKASLDYYGRTFGPYQFRQLRIAEFPRYGQFALALPGTVPFSESAGFIFRPGSGDDDLDLPFYVTAHEVGHQWWGHQVAGANVQGVRWLSEGLANYSALTVMEEAYGLESLQKFLANELDRYLYGRSLEPKRELPLVLVENQDYIHYNKGSLALYAFRDLIGEDAMNRALAKFVSANALQGPPYPTSRDLVALLAAETPDSLKYVITDLFETISLWDNRTEDANYTRRPDGRYEVTIKVSARKLRVDSLGIQREVPMADLVDLGVFGEREPGKNFGKPLYLAKVWVRRDTTFTIVVDREPKRAGIDPYNKLIDRNRNDNVKDVRRGGR